MRLLLDTHIFLWAVAGSPRPNPVARDLIESAEQVYASAASIWEVAIKAARNCTVNPLHAHTNSTLRAML